MSKFLINDLLFLFDIFEHKFAFGQIHIIRKHFGISFVKLTDFRQSLNGFVVLIVPFKEF